MNEIAYIIIRVAVTMIWVLQAAMFVRAIMSWIPGLDENKFGDFLYALTEPFIVPVRALWIAFRFFRASHWICLFWSPICCCRFCRCCWEGFEPCETIPRNNCASYFPMWMTFADVPKTV